MTTTEAADSVAMIEEALVTIVREVGRPRLQEQLAREAGVAVERAGYNLLRLLDEQGSVPITGLARGLGLDNSTVSRQVHALERGGMVSRFRGPTDRRVMGIALTEAGREALELAPRRVGHPRFVGVVDDRRERSVDVEEERRAAGLGGELGERFHVS